MPLLSFGTTAVSVVRNYNYASNKNLRCLSTTLYARCEHGSTSMESAAISAVENRNLVERKENLYRERFIPLTRMTLVSYLLQDEGRLTDVERKEFEKFALSLDVVVGTRYTAILQELKQLFEPISPDKDTVTTRQFNRKNCLDSEFWLIQRLGQVMEKANFYEVTESEMKSKLLENEKDEGLKVSIDIDKYDVLKFWVLGKEQVPVHHSLLRKLITTLRQQPLNPSSALYKRVIAAVRLKKDEKLTLKAFKDIPITDLEKLLPVGSVRMGKFDRYMIMTSVGLAGVGILAKFITVLAKMAPVNWPLGFAAVTSLLGVRGYWAYTGRQNKYLSRLNETLYYKNIANNRGLITLVVDRAQDETFKEVLLTFTFIQALSRATEAKPLSPHGDSNSGSVTSIALENAVEQWIFKQCGAVVEFDSAESISILEKVGILSRVPVGMSETLKVLPLEQAHKLLPQTPLSILTRVDDSDVTEGYDRSKYDRTEPVIPKGGLRRFFTTVFRR